MTTFDGSVSRPEPQRAMLPIVDAVKPYQAAKSRLRAWLDELVPRYLPEARRDSGAPRAMGSAMSDAPAART